MISWGRDGGACSGRICAGMSWATVAAGSGEATDQSSCSLFQSTVDPVHMSDFSSVPPLPSHTTPARSEGDGVKDGLTQHLKEHKDTIGFPEDAGRDEVVYDIRGIVRASFPRAVNLCGAARRLARHY